MRASRYDRLHLGCGDNPLERWGNLDLKAKGKVTRWELTRKLPARSGSIEYVFSEHFLEHLTRDQAIALLTECHRVLKPGGILRISTPALEKLIEEYLAGRTEEWREMNWAPDTPCQMVNEGMRLWGHEFVFDRTELTLVLDRPRIRTLASARPSGRERHASQSCASESVAIPQGDSAPPGACTPPDEPRLRDHIAARTAVHSECHRATSLPALCRSPGQPAES